MEELINETTQVNLLSNAFVEYQPIEGLVIKSTFNAELYNSKFFFFNPSTATSRINRPLPTTAESIRENIEDFTWLNENLATYSRSFNDEHHFQLLGGFTLQKFRRERTRIQADTYSNDQLPTIQGAININRAGTNSGVEEWGLISFLSRLNYNYKGKYLLTLAIRTDGSSRFGSENRWGTFPSASVGWVASDEDFFQSVRTRFLCQTQSQLRCYRK